MKRSFSSREKMEEEEIFKEAAKELETKLKEFAVEIDEAVRRDGKYDSYASYLNLDFNQKVKAWADFCEVSAPLSNVNPDVSTSDTASPSNPAQSNSPAEISTSSYSFYPPSGFFFKKCCEKLELNYSHDAYAFWSQISVNGIMRNSIPQNTHTVLNQKMSGFASLSLLFTGSEDNASEIKDNLNKYFSQNSLAIGKLVGQDFSQLSNPNVIEILFSADLTEIHLVALAQWFGCRFALFENGIWKRYGKWNNFKTYLPIVLMEKKDGKYSPIFSLKE